jgi:hypothetical protein
MKITNHDIIEAVPTINYLNGLKLLPKASFPLALNAKAIDEYLKVFYQERNKLVESFAKKDADGKPLHKKREKKEQRPVMVGEVQAKDEKGNPKFEVITVLDADGKIVMEDNPDVLDLGDTPAEMEPFNKAFTEFMQMDAGESIKIRKIKISSFGDKEIEGNHWMKIDWMIDHAD